MKVAIPAEGPNFDARVCDRLGLAPYLLIIDLESKSLEAVQTPKDSGSGMEVVALIIAKKSDILVTKWCSPTAERYLSAYGVEIVIGISGTVAQVLDEFERKNVTRQMRRLENLAPFPWKLDPGVAAQAIRSAFNQIRSLLPVMMGVVFLLGLFSAFMSEEFLASYFSGSMWWESLWGASIGSVFTGNPINSYIIGGQMVERGVSLVAVTAFICSWVTVGLIQVPAESMALGWKFAVIRNLSCFLLSVAISLVMVPIRYFFRM